MSRKDHWEPFDPDWFFNKTTPSDLETIQLSGNNWFVVPACNSNKFQKPINWF